MLWIIHFILINFLFISALCFNVLWLLCNLEAPMNKHKLLLLLLWNKKKWTFAFSMCSYIIHTDDHNLPYIFICKEQKFPEIKHSRKVWVWPCTYIKWIFFLKNAVDSNILVWRLFYPWCDWFDYLCIDLIIYASASFNKSWFYLE